MQYFYLVVLNYDEYTNPLKVFLQENEAIKYGRRQATIAWEREHDPNYCYKLYRQLITRTGELEYVKTLTRYINNVKGSDNDIDLKR